MDLRITFDISDKLDAALGRLAVAIEAVRTCTVSPTHCEEVECPVKSPEIAPITQTDSEQPVTQPEPEVVKCEPVLAQSGSEIEHVANDDDTEKAEPKKPTKKKAAEKKAAEKKAAEKAETAPVTQTEPEQKITQAESESAKSGQVLAQNEPESVKAEEPSKMGDDGMAGMNLMEAARQLIKDIQDAGIEMADANARVRAKAEELNLNFGSVTCLIKAIGYTEARKVAIGK